MDPAAVSVINLEDEYPATVQQAAVIGGENRLSDDNLLNVESIGGELDQSGLSSPPEPSSKGQSGIGGDRSTGEGSLEPGPGRVTVQDHHHSGVASDQLIREVIDQLERHCSTSNEDELRMMESSNQLPLAAGLFTKSSSTGEQRSASPSMDIFEKNRSPINSSTMMTVGDSVTQQHSKSIGGRHSPEAYSMWIASAKTRETLALLPPNGDGRICYTMPGIMVEESLGDPIADAMRKYCPDEPHRRSSPSTAAQHRSPATATNAPISIPNLLESVAAGDFRAAVDATGRWLKMHGQGSGKAHQPSRNTEESLKIWSLRLHLLVNLGQYNLANSELDAFANLDAPDLYYEYYPETHRGRKGSLVPFSMRLLHGELPRLTGQPAESLIRLNRIVAVIRQIIKTLNDEPAIDKSALDLWRNRQRKAHHVLVRCLYGVKDFRLSSIILDGLLETEPRNRGLSGRLQLVLGDLNTAKMEFQKFQDHFEAGNDDQRAKGLTAMHCGYTHVFNNNFAEALAEFQKVTQYDPTNVMAINNSAVSLLYLGRLDEAVAVMEQAIQSNPHETLQEGLCTNLCTLYELESARSSQKKTTILKLIDQHKSDSMNIACLKLPP